MSIRPIDNAVLLPKSQEVSGIKQSEISKGENITHNNFVHTEKKSISKQQKVINTNKVEYNKISRDNPKQEKNNNQNDDKDSEKKDNSKNNTKGINLDIRI